MTWIDVAEGDGDAVTRADYEKLIALIDTAEETRPSEFVITRPALERLLRSIAVDLQHSGQ